MTAPRLRFRFWGVRGSTPTPERDNLGYGGNTPCLEVRYGCEAPLIFDAGSGLRRLGLALRSEFHEGAGHAAIFLSHFHWDHVQGIPFFEPMYFPEWDLRFYSGYSAAKLEEAVRRQFLRPHFSAESAIRAAISFDRIDGESLALGEVRVTAFPVFHPGGCWGFRIDSPGGAIVYVTDHEHGNAEADAALRLHACGADVLIYDAQYTPEEYERSRKGWGHSTWQEGIRAAADAGMGQVILFHHDPSRDDAALNRMLEEAASEFPAVAAAREGDWTTL